MYTYSIALATVNIDKIIKVTSASSYVLVLVIVSKISLSIAILFYALVYDDDDEDDAGLSSGAGTNLKVGGTCHERSAGKFFCRALHVLCFIYLYMMNFVQSTYTFS